MASVTAAPGALPRALPTQGVVTQVEDPPVRVLDPRRQAQRHVPLKRLRMFQRVRHRLQKARGREVRRGRRARIHVLP